MNYGTKELYFEDLARADALELVSDDGSETEAGRHFNEQKSRMSSAAFGNYRQVQADGSQACGEREHKLVVNAGFYRSSSPGQRV